MAKEENGVSHVVVQVTVILQICNVGCVLDVGIEIVYHVMEQEGIDVPPVWDAGKQIVLFVVVKELLNVTNVMGMERQIKNVRNVKVLRKCLNNFVKIL